MAYPTKSKCSILRPLVLLAIMLLWNPLGYGRNDATLVQTKTKLEQLDTRINTLQQVLKTANNKHSLLNTELASTDKKISSSIQELRNTKVDLLNKHRRVDELQARIDTLNALLKKQQAALAEHVRSRYKMGEYQPLKWLVDQNEPYTLSRLFTYYQYIMHSYQHTLDSVISTQKSLTINQDTLQKEILAQQALQEIFVSHQQKLLQEKHYQTALIQSLDVEIQNKQRALNESKQNRNNLSQLLKSLTEKSLKTATYPFVRMQRKLPHPVSGSSITIQPMNQGVTFFATEGSPVLAVHSGKVVFSDWLNGYGLLLILDHGDGFMTLYANNEALFKQKGDRVTRGDQIATVGHSGGIKQNGLYFEVRRRGKAIPPLAWMS